MWSIPEAGVITPSSSEEARVPRLLQKLGNLPGRHTGSAAALAVCGPMGVAFAIMLGHLDLGRLGSSPRSHAGLQIFAGSFFFCHSVSSLLPLLGFACFHSQLSGVPRPLPMGGSRGNKTTILSAVTTTFKSAYRSKPRPERVAASSLSMDSCCKLHTEKPSWTAQV